MKEFLNIGIVGLGQRGTFMLRDTILPQKDVNVVAVCDVYEDRCEDIARLIEESGRPRPKTAQDYHEILKMDEVDAILVTSAWEAHLDITCDAMEAGKIVGFEVGGAYSIEDCWRLIRTYEKTGVPCSMLENCCYGRNELMMLNMARMGAFGEIVHCEGGYCHDLRDEISYGRENRHYRFRNYLNRCCDNYPTHDLGPIANILDINHGNRMLSLVSMASKARGLHSYIMDKEGAGYDAATFDFAQGDVVTTIIKCAHGETIQLTLDTTLPRAYSRRLQVSGTKGMYQEDNQSIFLDGRENEFHDDWYKRWNNIEEYREEFDHPIWKQFIKDGVNGGHGGLDWLLFRAFVDAAKEGKGAPVDVYDAVTWMSISVLTEQSIAMGGMPVAIPDFTNGKWIERPKWEP
ncbi:MAG: Gfo/Idh/MocA family oxidoreductase [Eubacteriales bacterium]|nr:Gfo/Idh/MocA family oxidoreductase [Eubacteriales bacterium]